MPEGRASARVRLHVEEQGSGPAVLFVHGFAGSARNWRPQRRALGARFHTVAFDLRGHARSEAPVDPAAYTMGALVDDALGVLEGAGESSAVLVGLSLGAAIALEAALRAPHAVRGLVLASIPAGRGAARGVAAHANAGRGIAAHANEFADAIEREGTLAAGERFAWGPGSGLDARGAALVRAGFLEHPSHGLAHTLRGVLAGLAPVAERGAELARVIAPTLAVAGALDAASLAPTRALAAAIEGARLEVVPDAGHVVNLAQPAAFDALLGAFLASLPPG